MKRLYTFSPLLLLLTLGGCKTDEAVPTPAVAKVTPMEGTPGTLLTIEGAGLTGLQKVMFGTENAPFNPVYNTDGALLIRVPAAAKYGAQTITLMNKGGDATKGTLSFNVLQPAPTIESFAPLEAAIGDTLTITGTVFDNLTAVNFGTIPGRVISSTTTRIRVKVPDKTEKGPIEVVTKGGAVKSAVDFAPKGSGLYIYDETIIGTWQNWSWAKVVLGDTEKAYKGTKAVKVSYTGYSAFWFNNPNPVDAAKFGTLKFWIFGGAGTDNKSVKVFYTDNDKATAETGKGMNISVKPGVWQEFALPLKNLGGAVKVKSILFQEIGGKTLDPVWYDEIRLQ
jgi:hypothetical protein